MWFLKSSSGRGALLNSFCDRCFLGCFPPFTGNFLDICFVLVFHLGWTSLPIAIVGLFTLGFLGVCLVLAIVY